MVNADRVVVGAAVGVQVSRQEHDPLEVAFRLADHDRARGKVDVMAVEASGLTGPQAQAVDHPEEDRDDQFPPAAPGRGPDRVGGVEQRPQLGRGEQVGAVADLASGDTAGDHERVAADADHVFGQLTHRGDPAQLTVGMLTRTGRGPAHRHPAGQRPFPGILVDTHLVEAVEVALRADVGQAQSVLEVQQTVEIRRQAADEPAAGHGRVPAGSIPVKSRQHSRMASSSAARYRPAEEGSWWPSAPLITGSGVPACSIRVANEARNTRKP